LRRNDHDGIVTHGQSREFRMHMKNPPQTGSDCIRFHDWKVNSYISTQTFVSFKKYMLRPLPYFKVNICPFPLPHFASIFFAYLWSFRWPNYIVTLWKLNHILTFLGMYLITNQTKIICLALYMQNYRWSKYDAMHCRRMHHLNPIKHRRHNKVCYIIRLKVCSALHNISDQWK
jgi:hypothetical protein